MRAITNRWCDLLATLAIALTLGLPSVRAGADEPKPSDANPVALRTARVTRGNLVGTVKAAGTLEPAEVVDVGAQVAGKITKLDVRYGTLVDEGTLLAQIDDTTYQAQVDVARAGVAQAQAGLAAARARVDRTVGDLKRAQELANSHAASTDDLDLARRAYATTQAVEATAEASIVQSQAALKQAELILSYTRIKSPVKGVVIDCRAAAGQTVAAGLNGPTLFLIAKDLKRMQVWVSVNEADVGRVRAGQPVSFTVDAHPGAVFAGKVATVRRNTVTMRNAVTYTVVVTADNSEEKLLPYLAADVRIEVARHQDVLLVPNAALRWQPQPEWITTDAREKTPWGSQKSGGGDGPPAARPAQQQRGCRVWVPDGQFVRPLTVQIGLSDGAMTEITGGDVREGVEIVVGGSIARSDIGQTRTRDVLALRSQFMRYLFTGSLSPQEVQRAIAIMGANVLLVLPGTAADGSLGLSSSAASSLTPADAEEIGRQCPAVIEAAPVVRARSQVVYGNRTWYPHTLAGTTPSFLAARDWSDLAEGDAFTAADVGSASKVCLIGETLQRELFQNASPLGKEIRIANVTFQVVGVLGHKGTDILGVDHDDIVLAPWTTIAYRVQGTKGGADQSAASRPTTGDNGMMSLYPGLSAPAPGASGTDAPSPDMPRRIVHVDQIVVKAASAAQLPAAREQVRQLLRQRYRLRDGQDDDFHIRDVAALIRAMSWPQR